MKIRTQDARQYLEYGEIYAEYSHDGKGVLYEVDLAYQTGQRVFYMPAE